MPCRHDRGNAMTTPSSSSLLIACAVFFCSGRPDTEWPIIQPIQIVRSFENPGKDDSDTPIKLTVVNSSGQPAYQIDCHNGNFDGSPQFNFSGDFQCVMVALTNGKPVSRNLLAAPSEQYTEWGNRGRMLARQLRPACASLSEYGAERQFRLRRMVVTLRFTNIEFDASSPTPDVLKHLTVEVSVVRADNARSAEAEETQAKPPSGECAGV